MMELHTTILLHLATICNILPWHVSHSSMRTSMEDIRNHWKVSQHVETCRNQIQLRAHFLPRFHMSPPSRLKIGIANIRQSSPSHDLAWHPCDHHWSLWRWLQLDRDHGRWKMVVHDLTKILIFHSQLVELRDDFDIDIRVLLKQEFYFFLLLAELLLQLSMLLGQCVIVVQLVQVFLLKPHSAALSLVLIPELQRVSNAMRWLEVSRGRTWHNIS